MRWVSLEKKFRTIYFRWVSSEELDDFRSHGALRSSHKSSTFGKHATSEPGLAREWGRLFEGGGAVLKIEVLEDVPDGVYHLGDNLDGIGPGYFISFEQLEKCHVSEHS